MIRIYSIQPSPILIATPANIGHWIDTAKQMPVTDAKLLDALVAELTAASPASEPESVLMVAEDPAPYHA